MTTKEGSKTNGNHANGELRLPAADHEERQLLGSLLRNPDQMPGVMSTLEAADFSDRKRGRVFAELSAWQASGDAFEIGAFATRLAEKRICTPADVRALIESVPVGAGAVGFARTVKNAATKRSGFDIATDLLHGACNGDDAADLVRTAKERLEDLAANHPDAGSHRPRKLTAPGLFDDDGLTETANAARFCERHGNNVRFCDPWNRFHVWSGRHWEADKRRIVERLAKEVVGDLCGQVTAQVADRAARGIEPVIRFVRASGSARGIRAMLDLARCELSILPADFDRDPWAINVLNGTVDLRTMRLRPHDRAEYLSKLCPVEFTPDADCPTWFAFIRRITAGNKDLMDFLRRAVGCSLSGAIRDHVLFFLHGSGANGKSTFLNTIEAMLGSDYAMKAPRGLLMVKREAHPTELTDLHGKRFVSCIEAEDGHRLAEALVKELTGGDRIRARRMREDFWQFDPTHKVWLAANHRPRIKGTDEGIWRRIKLVPFTVAIPKEEQDADLPEKLKTELPGILNWALLGCLEWQDKGLQEPEVVSAATAAYRSEMDVVGEFIEQHCIKAPGARARAADLYGAFQKWAEANGERAASQRRFGEQLTEHGFERMTSNGTWYVGIGLRSELQ